MIKRILALLLVACLGMGILAACNTADVIDANKATQIALDDMGIKESEAEEIHVHITEYEGLASFSVYISYNGSQIEYIINGKTGEILHKGAGSHSH